MLCGLRGSCSIPILTINRTISWTGTSMYLSMCVSVCVYDCLHDFLSVWMTVVCLSEWPLSVCLNDRLSVCLFVWMSVSLSVCLYLSCVDGVCVPVQCHSLSVLCGVFCLYVRYNIAYDWRRTLFLVCVRRTVRTIIIINAIYFQMLIDMFRITPHSSSSAAALHSPRWYVSWLLVLSSVPILSVMLLKAWYSLDKSDSNERAIVRYKAVYKSYGTCASEQILTFDSESQNMLGNKSEEGSSLAGSWHTECFHSTALHYTTLHYTTLLVSRQYSAVQLITWHQYNSIRDSTIHAELLPLLLLLLLLLCPGPQAHSTLIVRHAELFTPYFIVNIELTIQSFLRSEGVG